MTFEEALLDLTIHVDWRAIAKIWKQNKYATITLAYDKYAEVDILAQDLATHCTKYFRECYNRGGASLVDTSQWYATGRFWYQLGNDKGEWWVQLLFAPEQGEGGHN